MEDESCGSWTIRVCKFNVHRVLDSIFNIVVAYPDRYSYNLNFMFNPVAIPGSKTLDNLPKYNIVSN
jgi:hypothetical protein